tara:strand:+ start:100 stop:456 length:357 start_codon:yes stop_codon:yes gene_type:complete
MHSKGDWTEHYNYSEISNLTSLSHGDYGKVSKQSYKAIDRRIQELFEESWYEGYHGEGWCPSEASFRESLKDGWTPEYPFQQCYELVFVNGRVLQWYNLSEKRRNAMIKNGQYLEEDW